ncbi:MAG: hypothetical protein MZV70_55650 [Desulfobacterales bacterium]|nr:hypothetical protein [Desulfobacterales bacterium]
MTGAPDRRPRPPHHLAAAALAGRAARSACAARPPTTCRAIDVDFPLGTADRGHRRLRLGQVHAAQGDPLQGPAQPPARPPRPGRRLPRHHRLEGAAPRAGGRPQPHRPHAALGAGLLRRLPGRHPPAVRR